jgi:hypothetical protein
VEVPSQHVDEPASAKPNKRMPSRPARSNAWPRSGAREAKVPTSTGSARSDQPAGSPSPSSSGMKSSAGGALRAAASERCTSDGT